MPPSWTSEQVLALSPDSGSTQNGKKLANPSKWQSLGSSDQAIWGECKGSGKEPYRTQIDLEEPAFNCSCPSRKFPCKHALGLFLIYADQSATIPSADPPEWVSQWLEKRGQRQQVKAEKQTAAKDPVAQAKRAAQRETKVSAGVEDLKLWLQDLVRGGLAAVQSESYSFWETPAARLVDAQAPGLARQIREIAGIPYSGDPQWPERLMERLGAIYLLLEGYQRLDSLPVTTQADIRTAIGWTQKQEDLLTDQTAQGQRDQWLILGKRVVEEERLRVQRTWIWGKNQQQAALILSFAAAGQRFDVSLIPGTQLDADLVFFPSAYPQRALIKTRHGSPESIEMGSGCGYPTIAQGLQAWQQALTIHPWLEIFPMPLLDVRILREGEQWVVCDHAGDRLLIPATCGKLWELFALAGGHPVALFGEWQQRSFVPLSLFTAGRFYGVSP